MDEEGLFAVGDLDVTFGNSGEEVEDGVGVEANGFEDAIDLGVLFVRRNGLVNLLDKRWKLDLYGILS